MAINVIDTNATIAIGANTSFDTYLLLPNVFVTSTSDALDGDNANGNKTILVHGGLIGESDGIALGLSNDANSGFNEVHIYETGSVFGESKGVNSFGGSLFLVNEGTIGARNDGVFADDGDNVIINYGVISGQDEGVEVSGTNNLVVNHGLISVGFSGNEAVELDTSLVGDTAVLFNYGTIDGSGGDGAIDGDNGDDRVVNRGVVIGDIDLKNGSDEFDGRGGTVDGVVQGGGGDDLYLIDDASIELEEFIFGGTDTVGTEVSYALGDHFENLALLGADDIDGFGNDENNLITTNIGANLIDGGSGTDTVSYGQSATGVVAQLFGAFDFAAINPFSLSSVTIPMARTAGGGGANGDVLVNVENLFGSSHSDFLLGSAEMNVLRGQSGDDTLLGNAGNDVLEGGSGADHMNGGAGTDTAAYATATSGVTVDLIINGNNTGDAAGDTYANVQNLRGSQNDDILNGTFGANRIEGLDGNDAMRGRGGGDIYVGGNGDDTFIFQNGFGAEQINDFEALNDNEKIDLSQVTAITDFADLFNNHLSISGANSVIDDGAGGTITLLNVTAALDANDFIF